MSAGTLPAGAFHGYRFQERTLVSVQSQSAPRIERSIGEGTGLPRMYVLVA